jgi:hypothetical protein
MTFDFPDLGGRRGDTTERFLSFVEQLEQAVDLLESGRPPLQRMALVVLDTLAEGLLFCHMGKVFLASDEPTWIEHRTFTAKERRSARERFNKRVAIANEKLESASPVYYPERILNEHDAAVFRVAHHYRNPVYHEGRHNPTLIHPVGRLYAQAIGRAFTRSHRAGWGVSSRRSFMEEVARLGLNTSVDRYFYPREAAQAITSRICDTLTVDSKILRAELEEDIVYRCDVLADSLAGLRRDGLDDHQLNKFIVDAQDWAANRGDETLLRLQAEHKALRDQSMENGTFDPATLEAMKEPEQQQWNHLFGPGQQVIARVDLQSHVRIRKDAERLRAWSGGEVGLLAKYQELDSALELLENAVYFMLWQWDRRIWAEENRMRGK